jgi:hypothetical protein
MKYFCNCSMIFSNFSQGITRTLAESSGTLRVPFYLYERRGKIHNAKISLVQEGITPTVEVSSTFSFRDLLKKFSC